MKYLIYIIIFIILAPLSGPGQDFDLLDGRKSVEIPFEFHNDFIIVNLIFNKIVPMKFILDTGAEHTILAKKEIASFMGLRFEREFTIYGADFSTILTAYLSRNVHIKVGEYIAPRHDILVLQDDYFNFEDYTGFPIHGILGADFFKRFVMKIDYKRHLITLYHPNHFEDPGSKFTKFEIEIIKNKPYFITQVQLKDDNILNVKLLIDSGASLYLLLHNDTHPDLQLPDKVIRGNIAKGLGGFMEGFLGRVDHLKIGEEFKFENVITNFQEILIDRDSLNLSGRNGILGNGLLSRFTVIIDYIREDMYLRPSKKYNKGFAYDRSGLQIIASGIDLSTFTINEVVPNSPAAEAGLKKGDQLLKVNSLSTRLQTLSGIVKKLQGKRGKRIRMTVRREEEKIKVKFRLRDLI